MGEHTLSASKKSFKEVLGEKEKKAFSFTEGLEQTLSANDKSFRDSLEDEDEKKVFDLFCRISKQEITPIDALIEAKRIAESI